MSAAETKSRFSESDASIAALMREMEDIPPSASDVMGRRSFLKLTTVGGAGLVLAFHLPADKAIAAATPQAINAFVRIAPDNVVTVYSKGPEIGQGIKTAFGLIIAEELDADWKRVVVEQANVNPKVYGYQGAGGSTSIPRAWDQLRQAGASAKAMLIAAVAKEWNVPASEITAQNSSLMHKASGKKASYGSLADAAAKMPVPDAAGLKLKVRSEYRLLGKRYSGVDNIKVVTGEPLFGIDVRVPGMVYANYTKCPAVGGKVASANLDEVKKLPGVLDAFVLEGTGKPLK